MLPENRLQQFIDSHSPVVFSLDAATCIHYIDQSAFDKWGYAPNELVGKPVLDIVLEEEDRKNLIEYIQQQINGVQGLPFNCHMQTKDERSVLVQWQAQWNEEEQLLYCAVCAVSGQKVEPVQHNQSKGNIGQQQRLTDEILKRMNQGFFALSNDLVVQHYNDHAAEIIGISKKEALGNKITALYNKKTLDLYLPMYEKVRKEHQPLHSEHMCPQSGKWVDVSIYPAQEGFIVFFKDIDERKKTELQLSKLSLVAKETDNIVVCTDKEGKITWVNNAFTNVTGYTMEEAYGHKPGTLLQGPESDPEAIRLMRKQLSRGKPFTVEIINYTKDKKKYWIELFCQPVKNDKGEVDQFFAIQRDITERKRMQQVLDDEKLQRQQMITAAAIAAQENERAQVGLELHDNVNQVLTTIKLYQELCLSGINNSGELVKKSIDLLQQSINEIRSLSKRLSAPTLGNIKLKDSIKELVDSVRVTGKVCISLDTTSVEKLEVDQKTHLALYRILQEHLTNVLKHAEAKCVQVLLTVVDNELTLKVSDNGKGFDVKKRRNGIGIANMMMRAESMKGTMNINSAAGIGCVLIVQIPLSKQYH